MNLIDFIDKNGTPTSRYYTAEDIVEEYIFGLRIATSFDSAGGIEEVLDKIELNDDDRDGEKPQSFWSLFRMYRTTLECGLIGDILRWK